MRARPDARIVPVWRDQNLVLGLGSDAADPPEAARCVVDAHDATLAADDTLPWALLGLDGEVPIFAVDVSKRNPTRCSSPSD